MKRREIAVATTKKGKTKNQSKTTKAAKAPKTTKAAVKIKASAKKTKTPLKSKPKIKTKVAKTSGKSNIATKVKAKTAKKSIAKQPTKQPAKKAKNLSKSTHSKVTHSKQKNEKLVKVKTQVEVIKPKGKAWLRPLDDRLLIELIEVAPVSPNGLIIIDSSNQPDNLQGVVLAVGRGHQNKKGRIRPIEVKTGDQVIFSKYAGDKIVKDGVNFVIIRESEILGFSAKESM